MGRSLRLVKHAFEVPSFLIRGLASSSFTACMRVNRSFKTSKIFWQYMVPACCSRRWQSVCKLHSSSSEIQVKELGKFSLVRRVLLDGFWPLQFCLAEVAISLGEVLWVTSTSWRRFVKLKRFVKLTRLRNLPLRQMTARSVRSPRWVLALQFCLAEVVFSFGDVLGVTSSSWQRILESRIFQVPQLFLFNRKDFTMATSFVRRFSSSSRRCLSRSREKSVTNSVWSCVKVLRMAKSWRHSVVVVHAKSRSNRQLERLSKLWSSAWLSSRVTRAFVASRIRAPRKSATCPWKISPTFQKDTLKKFSAACFGRSSSGGEFVLSRCRQFSESLDSKSK